MGACMSARTGGQTLGKGEWPGPHYAVSACGEFRSEGTHPAFLEMGQKRLGSPSRQSRRFAPLNITPQ